MKLFENKAVRFEIPPGWEDGSAVRFEGPRGGAPFAPSVAFTREDSRATVLTYALEQVAKLTPKLPNATLSSVRNTSLGGLPACELDMDWDTPDGPVTQRRTFFRLEKKMWTMTASAFRGTFEQNVPVFAKIAGSVVLGGSRPAAKPAPAPARPPSSPPIPFATGSARAPSFAHEPLSPTRASFPPAPLLPVAAHASSPPPPLRTAASLVEPPSLLPLPGPAPRAAPPVSPPSIAVRPPAPAAPAALPPMRPPTGSAPFLPPPAASPRPLPPTASPFSFAAKTVAPPATPTTSGTSGTSPARAGFPSARTAKPSLPKSSGADETTATIAKPEPKAAAASKAAPAPSADEQPWDKTKRMKARPRPPTSSPAERTTVLPLPAKPAVAVPPPPSPTARPSVPPAARSEPRSDRLPFSRDE